MYEPWLDVRDPAVLYGAASGIPGTQRLVQCLDCRMIYENPRFPEEVILGGYLSSEEGGHDSQYAMRVESFWRGLTSVRAHMPPRGARVLDIGTAGGAFLEAARRFGYDAKGLEPSRFLVEQARKRGLDVQQGTIDDQGFPPASFDMVCLWDVLEHIPNPKDTLRKIKPLLKGSGVLLVNYPDIGTWLAKIAGRRFWWIISVHLHHFTRETIRRVFECAGFEARHFQRYWQTLQIGYLEGMAIHYRIPLSTLIKKLTPGFVQSLPISYYASQTTVVASVKP